MKKLSSILALILILSGKIFAQMPGWTLFDFSKSGYTVDPTTVIVQHDNFGNYWFGTDKGLFKFDGKAWDRIFDIKNFAPVAVSGLVISPGDGHVWVNAYEGKYTAKGQQIYVLAEFDGNKWRKFYDTTSGLYGYGYHKSSAGFVVDSSNNIWSINYSDVFKFDIETDKFGFQYGVQDHGTVTINDVAVDIYGRVWCSFNIQQFQTEKRIGYGALAYFNPKNKVMVFDTNINDYNTGYWYAVAQELTADNNGGLYYSKGGGLLNYSDGISKPVKLPYNSGPRINELFFHNNILWVGTDGSGLLRYQDGEWIVYNTSNSGLIGNKVSSIYEDNIGNIWIGTDKGLVVYRPGGVILSAEENSSKENFSLKEISPNPANDFTTIKYSIGKNSFVELKVFDMLGREIATLANGEKSSGNYEEKFSTTNLESGAYIFRLRAAEKISSKQFLVVK